MEGRFRRNCRDGDAVVTESPWGRHIEKASSEKSEEAFWVHTKEGGWPNIPPPKIDQSHKVDLFVLVSHRFKPLNDSVQYSIDRSISLSIDF